MFSRKFAFSAIALAVFGSAASAATVHFNTNKSWSSSGHTYGAVTVTGARVDTNGKILTNDEYVASWGSRYGGLGVCSAKRMRKCTYGWSERRGRDRHTIDGKKKDELVLIDFGSMNVQIDSVTFSYWDSNDDFNYAIFSSLAIGSSPIKWKEDISGGSSPFIKTFTFAAGELVGSIFGFGADYKDDEFKLKKLTYTILPPSQVPLPAAGLLLIGALGGLAALRRYRKG